MGCRGTRIPGVTTCPHDPFMVCRPMPDPSGRPTARTRSCLRARGPAQCAAGDGRGRPRTGAPEDRVGHLTPRPGGHIIATRWSPRAQQGRRAVRTARTPIVLGVTLHQLEHAPVATVGRGQNRQDAKVPRGKRLDGGANPSTAKRDGLLAIAGAHIVASKAVAAGEGMTGEPAALYENVRGSGAALVRRPVPGRRPIDQDKVRRSLR